jgi:hypothetical protein
MRRLAVLELAISVLGLLELPYFIHHPSFPFNHHYSSKFHIHFHLYHRKYPTNKKIHYINELVNFFMFWLLFLNKNALKKMA